MSFQFYSYKIIILKIRVDWEKIKRYLQEYLYHVEINFHEDNLSIIALTLIITRIRSEVNGYKLKQII